MLTDLEQIVRVLAGLCPLRSMAESTERRWATILGGAAAFISPRLYSRFTLSMIVYPLFGELIAIRYSGGFLPFLLGALAAIQFLPILAPYLMLVARAKQTEFELPFFIMGLSVFSHESYPTIRDGFSRVSSIGQGLFRAFQKEASILERNLTFLQGSADQIVEITFSSSPSQKLREFIHGFTSTLSLGKDVANFVESEALRHISILEDSWRAFAGSLASIAEFSFLLLALFPVGLQMIAATLPSVSSDNVLLLSYALLVSLSVVLIIVVDATSPKVSNRTPSVVYPAIVVITSFASMLLYYLHILSAWESVLVPLVSSAIASARTMGLHRVVGKGDKEVALLVHDLAEETKVGVSLPEALSRIASKYTTRSPMHDCLMSFYQSLRLGKTPTQAANNIKHPSWLVKVAFGLISLAFVTGAGFEQLERLSLLLKRVTDAKVAASRSLIPFIGMGLAVPAISVFSLTFLTSLTQLGSILGPLASSDVSGRYTSLSIILSSLLTGILLSKLMTSSVRNLVAVPLVLTATLVSFLIGGIG